MATKKQGYLGLSWLISLILAIIPFTNVILGIITRVQNKKYLLAVLNFFIAPIFYIVDLVSMLINKSLNYLV